MRCKFYTSKLCVFLLKLCINDKDLKISSQLIFPIHFIGFPKIFRHRAQLITAIFILILVLLGYNIFNVSHEPVSVLSIERFSQSNTELQVKQIRVNEDAKEANLLNKILLTKIQNKLNKVDQFENARPHIKNGNEEPFARHVNLDGEEKGNGVQHTRKVNSTQKILKSSPHKVILFISKKSSMINTFSNKIKTVFSSKFNTQFN